MFCSTIIPTTGRATLARAVNSVLDQYPAMDDFEIVVVNDSGKPLPRANWQNSPRVRVLHTDRHDRSVARNAGAAIAHGQYLHFLDEDDWILPGAFEAFWQFTQARKVVWLYGATQLVNSTNEPLIRLHHGLHGNVFSQVMAGEWIPLQSSLLDAEEFFRVGGFNPLIGGPSDVDLTRRIALHGDCEEITTLISCVRMRIDKSTTDSEQTRQMGQQTREEILDESNVRSRLWQSAHSSYWRGRLVRVYLTSVVWNLQHSRLLTAMSRFAYASVSLAQFVPNFLSLAFWHAIFKSYQSETFRRGFRELDGLSPLSAS